METSVKPPMAMWLTSIVASFIALVSGIFVGGSLGGYVFGLIGTLVAVVALFVNRRRAMNPDFDYSRPWFNKAIGVSYGLSVAVTVLHIVRYAIAYANS